ncbi:MAG: FAD-dependent thymidylate synthase [Anaerolineaceae bacterium]|jgi:thymidylate synthase ThyX
MNLSRRVYRLSPSQLSAETIAVTFAKTSRSPEPFDVIAAELDAEKSARFSEKWIVGYGHSSVAEHAILHLALENISRLAIETIESNRLASYTEKSTRYQEWNSKAYVIPEEVVGSAFEDRYISVLDGLFATYSEAVTHLRAWSETNTPRIEGEADKAWANRARTKAVDVSRFLLPAASMANVGVTINARALEYAIKKMLSSELQEIQSVGAEVKSVATQELPTLVKYANPIAHLDDVRKTFRQQASKIIPESGQAWCQLLQADPQGQERVLAAVLFRFGEGSYSDCLQQVLAMSTADKTRLVDSLFVGANDFDVPLRELEYTSYDFDLIMDQGAYFEFKRHRMMSQTAQPLTAHLGYAIPKAICEAGFEMRYRQAMEMAGDLYEDLAAWNPEVAAYVVPNGYNRRVLCRLNLRELFHFVKLRCGENAHFSIRRVARGMFEQVREIHPLFSAKINVSGQEDSQSISEAYFSELAVQAAR